MRRLPWLLSVVAAVLIPASAHAGVCAYAVGEIDGEVFVHPVVLVRIASGLSMEPKCALMAVPIRKVWGAAKLVPH